MSKIRLSLRNFFQMQQAEEQQDVPPVTVPETAEAPTDQNVPEEADADQESTDETAEEVEQTADETPAPDATATVEEPVRTEEMSVADYDALVADAGNWRTNKAELERLRNWHSNSQRSGTLPHADANAGGSNQSWKEAPWNK